MSIFRLINFLSSWKKENLAKIKMNDGKIGCNKFTKFYTQAGETNQ